MKSLAIAILACASLSQSLASFAQPKPEAAEAIESADSPRYGVMGLPAGSRGDMPSVAPQRHAQWIVRFDIDDKPVHWQRVEKIQADETGSDVASLTHQLAIDAEPPNAVLHLSGDAIERDQAWIVSPRVTLSITSDDLSGVASTTLLIDGQPAANPDNWAKMRVDGRYALSLRATDALENTGERGKIDVVLDSTPPTLTWQRLDAREGVAADIFDGKRARISINVADAAAGVRELQLGQSRYAESELASLPVTLKVDASTLNYTLSDKVSNVAEGIIALRPDSDGPTLTAIRNGQPVDLNGATLKRSDSLTLRADDALAGVARACVEASIWYGKCTELPVDLIGIAPGRYALEFRAADRLGNKTYTRLSMEVLP